MFFFLLQNDLSNQSVADVEIILFFYLTSFAVEFQFLWFVRLLSSLQFLS